MEREFKYGKRDGWARFLTTTVIVILSAGLVAVFYFLGVVYITMWTSVVLAVIISLFVLSVPRKIIVSDDCVELRCVLETTLLPLEQITSVRRDHMRRRMVCLWGARGFFGYYGYYVDLRGLTGGDYLLTRVSATNRKGLVEIICRGKRYLVGCSEPDALVGELRQRIPVGKPQENNQ